MVISKQNQAYLKQDLTEKFNPFQQPECKVQ